MMKVIELMLAIFIGGLLARFLQVYAGLPENNWALVAWVLLSCGVFFMLTYESE
jgi:hypothetical protein